jgi:hypothetical protein
MQAYPSFPQAAVLNSHAYFYPASAYKSGNMLHILAVTMEVSYSKHLRLSNHSQLLQGLEHQHLCHACLNHPVLQLQAAVTPVVSLHGYHKPQLYCQLVQWPASH